MGSYVVDTHALIWYLEGNPRLGADVRAALDDLESTLYLPIIALAEACWIVEHGRTSIPMVDELLEDVDGDPRLTVVPLDRLTLDRSLSLAEVGEMHDRQIAARALQLRESGHEVVLLTRDENITQAGVVPVAW